MNIEKVAKERDDKTQVGLTEEAFEVLDRLRKDKLIREESDGYKLAVAYAITNIPDFAQETKGYTNFVTKFHTSGLDKDGLLKDLVEASGIGPAGEPYRTAERLAVWGLLELSNRLTSHREMERILSSDPLIEEPANSAKVV